MIGPKASKLTKAETRRLELASRHTLRDRDPWCVMCGAGGELTVDHRLNRSQGGTWDMWNLQRLCGDGTRGCHGWVTGNPASAVAQGFAVPAGRDPRLVPARRREAGGLVWVLYLPGGSVRRLSAAEAAELRAAYGVR